MAGPDYNPIDGRDPAQMTDEELEDEKTLDEYTLNLPRGVDSWEMTELGLIYTGRVELERDKRRKQHQEEQQRAQEAAKPRPPAS